MTATGVIDNPVIEPPASNPPERFEFPKASDTRSHHRYGFDSQQPGYRIRQHHLGNRAWMATLTPCCNPEKVANTEPTSQASLLPKRGTVSASTARQSQCAVVGRITAIDSGEWWRFFVEFVHATIASEQPNGVAYLGFDLTQINPDGTESTRFELTPEKPGALEFARQNGILIVVAASNQGGVMSVLGQASREFDNIIAVGAAENVRSHNLDGKDSIARTTPVTDADSISSHPAAPFSGGILSTVGNGIGTMAGTSVAAPHVWGPFSLIQAANPDLNTHQVKDILKLTATDLNLTGTDDGCGVAEYSGGGEVGKGDTRGRLQDPPDSNSDASLEWRRFCYSRRTSHLRPVPGESFLLQVSGPQMG